MGYSMSQVGSKFFVKAENKHKAFESLQELYSLEDCKVFEDAMDYLNWNVEVDKNYNVVKVDFMAENLRDDYEIFEAISPFVESGSFIEMLGEDGRRWRWLFNGETCKEKFARIVWD